MRTIDEIYTSIGQSIANNIPSESWEAAWINAKVIEDSTGVDGEYTEPNSSEVKYFEVDDSAFDDFEELHEITTEGGNNKWNRAKFTLSLTGKFSIDFEWDQSLADEIERLS